MREEVWAILDDDVSLDEVIDRLYFLRKIELGIAQSDSADVMEHDAFDALSSGCLLWWRR